MVERSVIAFAAATVASLVLATGPAASDDGAPQEGIIVFGTPPADHEGDLEWFECQNEPQLALRAIDLPGCGDYGGEHVMGSGDDYFVIFGFRVHETGKAGPIPLTGALHARLSWDHDEIDFRCHWNEGDFSACDIGIWPPPPGPGETFSFTCTTASTAPYVQEGAFGHWGDCFLAHS